MYHFVAKIVGNWKLPKEKIEPTIKGLIKKLEDSEYCCHYSGLKITPGLNANEISEHIKKSIPSVARYISSLKKRELIEFRGATKTGGYYIITEKKEEK